ncbi:MAG: hypothetical protein ACREPP_11555 [Rhodanobacteraceae bacterium]
MSREPIPLIPVIPGLARATRRQNPESAFHACIIELKIWIPGSIVDESGAGPAMANLKKTSSP